MAKKKKKNRSKSTRKTARKAVRRAVGAVKKRKSGKRKSGKRKTSRKPRRIGAVNRQTMNTKSLIRSAMKGAVTGVSAYATKRLLAMVPATVNPWLKDGGAIVLGTLISTKAEGVGLGIAGKGVENILDRVVPGAVNGIGRRRGGGRLTEAEVRAIERAAMSDRVNGMEERVVVGQPVGAGVRDIV